MKKILNLMILTTFTAPLLNLTKTNLNLYIQKRETTPNPKTISSLQEMITTINIGQIETNTQEDIIQGLQQAQNLNPATNLIREFLLTQNNNNNLEFEINHNTARIHLRIGQHWNNTIFIPKIKTFTINFWTNRFILPSIITTNDIEYVEDNSSYTILRTLQEIYPLITQLNLHLNVSNITTNSARISYSPENNFSNLKNNYVDINFQTNHPTLNTINLNTNLGQLQNNSSSTILSTFLNVNSSNTSLLENITVGEITNNSAIIYGQTHIESWREIWIHNENNLFFRPATIEETYNNLVQFYEITHDSIRVTFTLQNNNQNETQISRPDTNSNDNNLFNYCPANINSNHQSIQKRNIENSNIKQYCMITSKTLTKDTAEGNLKSGDTYFGTNNGVFLKINNRLYKFHGLNFPIIDIKLDNQGSAYIVNDKKEIYHLNLHGWDSIKMPNAESTNLAKEIKLFYNQKKENLEIENNWGNKPWNYTIIHDFNLGNINPFDYEKIEFLGNSNNFYSKISWGNTAYYGKKLNEFNSKKLKDYLIKHHFVRTVNGIEKNNNSLVYKFTIQDFQESSFLAHIIGYQDLFLISYKKNNNYHLQVLVNQEVIISLSSTGGSVWLNLGKGIRLYND